MRTPAISKSMELMSVTDNGIDMSGGGDSVSANRRSQNSDHKAAITVGIIMGTFLFCWVPFFTLNILSSLCEPCIPGEFFRDLVFCGNETNI